MPEQKESCCPEFNPAPFDDKILEWNNKKFIKDKVFTFFYMPVNFSKVIMRLFGKMQNAGAVNPDNMALSDHTSKWNMDLYLAVDKKVDGAENISMSGRFYSRVYEGPYRSTGKWMDHFANSAAAKGLKIVKMYMWYAYCPKCAKKFGKNYVAILGKCE